MPNLIDCIVFCIILELSLRKLIDSEFMTYYPELSDDKRTDSLDENKSVSDAPSLDSVFVISFIFTILSI